MTQCIQWLLCTCWSWGLFPTVSRVILSQSFKEEILILCFFRKGKGVSGRLQRFSRSYSFKKEDGIQTQTADSKWKLSSTRTTMIKPTLLRDNRQPRGRPAIREEGISCPLPIYFQARLWEKLEWSWGRSNDNSSHSELLLTAYYVPNTDPWSARVTILWASYITISFFFPFGDTESKWNHCPNSNI